MTESGGGDLHERVGLCLSTAAVSRVSSIVPIFFDRLAGLRSTDLFDAKQGVEMSWRELSGQPRSDALRRELVERIPAFRRLAAESTAPGSTAVVAALDAISVLIEEPVGVRERLQGSLQASLNVALDFDLHEVAAPAGHGTWTAYELHGQAALVELLPINSMELPAELVSKLRRQSGMESMNYRNAMSALPSE